VEESCPTSPACGAPRLDPRLRFQVLEIKLRFFGIYCGLLWFIVVYCGLLFQDVSMLQGRLFWKVLKKSSPTGRDLSMSDMRDRWWANIGQRTCFETSKQCKTNHFMGIYGDIIGWWDTSQCNMGISSSQNSWNRNFNGLVGEIWENPSNPKTLQVGDGFNNLLVGLKTQCPSVPCLGW
jgi:hypothetical protein